jgi:hypothetical protein
MSVGSPEIISAAGASILVEKFPRIARFLHVQASGWVSARLAFWDLWEKSWLSPAEQSAAYEQWADFYQWHLGQRAGELAGDHLRRRELERWTDDMVYLSRRCAAYARGEDPGEWIPSWERRVEKITAPAARRGHIPDRQPVEAGAAR